MIFGGNNNKRQKKIVYKREHGNFDRRRYFVSRGVPLRREELGTFRDWYEITKS